MSLIISPFIIRAKISIFVFLISCKNTSVKFKINLAIILFICSFTSVWASHIVGGDFSYRWIGGNNFEFNLKLYRDCNTPVPFDDSITIGIFNKVTNTKTDTLEMHLFSFGPVVLTGPAASCIIPAEICVEQGIYIDTITIPNNPQGYYIVWERCCRNASVVNIGNPTLTGLAFYAEMPDPALHNSSPVFVNDPIPFICENQPMNYSFAATDTNGDALVYELADPLAGNIGYPTTSTPTATLVTPLPGPYATVQWTPGYSLANVCASSTNPLNIDAVSGNLSVTVDYSGIYAMAVIVHEFRNGIEIGLIRREIEFSVIVCPNDPPQLNLSSALPFSGNTFTIYESDTICFNAIAADAADSVYLYYSGEVFPGGTISTPYATANNDSGLANAVSMFCWNTKCGHARATPYKVAYTVRDNGCPLPATTTDTIYIQVQPCPVVNGVNLLCIGLRDNAATEVIWSDTASIVAKYFKRYEIFRSVNGSPFTLLGSVTDPAISSFLDSTASDYLLKDYCYYVQGVNTCGDIGPPSNTVCTVSQFNTAIIYIKQVSVIDSGKLEVTWKDFPAGPYSTLHVYRKENSPSGQYELRATLVHPNYNSWTDNIVNTSEKSYCYSIVNEDYCGNLSPASNTGCSILLKGNSLAYEDYLYWTPYSTWANGVKEYQVFRKSTSGSYTGIIILPDSTFFYRDLDLDLNNGQFKYYVKAIENPGSLDGESVSNEITLSQMPVAFLPNSFTPDGDNLNDTWGLTSSFVKTFILKVFNRNGLLVFESSNKKLLWNGTFNGRKAQPGTYVYTLRYTGFQNEKERVSSGTVTLVR
jgi:gliding motility-associated-like protein